jgi:hypothetical protein
MQLWPWTHWGGSLRRALYVVRDDDRPKAASQWFEREGFIVGNGLPSEIFPFQERCDLIDDGHESPLALNHEMYSGGVKMLTNFVCIGTHI